jgi:RNA polymerase sigma-70 factor, ECF subfamily
LPTFYKVYNLCRTFMADRPDLTNPAEFSAAFDAHHRSVYAAAYRVLGDHAQANDVVQDVFLRLWRRPQAFDAARGDIGTYLRLMGRSRAVDLWREGQARGRATDRFKVYVGEQDPHVDDRPDLAIERKGDRSAVRDALRELPAAQREALVLAYWGGMTAEQVAAHEHIPLGTAKSRIRLGLAKLRGEMEHAAVA